MTDIPMARLCCDLQDDNKRLRAILLKAYQFISPLSDPMPITNKQMAQEIMAAITTGKSGGET